MMGKSSFFESYKTATLLNSEAGMEMSVPQTTESQILGFPNRLNQRKIWF